MRHPNLKEITFREVFYNIKEYYNNRKQFFIKIRHIKGLRTHIYIVLLNGTMKKN